MDIKKYVRILIKGLKWAAICLGGLYVLVLLIRFPFWLRGQKTRNEILRINDAILSREDVMGSNLPLDPGSQKDTTIAGVDANMNGIRDDVERAIFEKYPDKARTRLPLLQHALSLQLQMTLSPVNTETVTRAIENTQSRAMMCTWTLSSQEDTGKFLSDLEMYRNFVTDLQLNTKERKDYLDSLFTYIRSYTMSNGGCDIDPRTLPN